MKVADGGKERVKYKEKMFSAIDDLIVGLKDSFGNVYPINYGYIPEMIVEMAKGAGCVYYFP